MPKLPATHLSFTVRFGELNEIEGLPHQSDLITFIPAQITLWGNCFESSFFLKDHLADQPASIKTIIKPGQDAPWVLGRLIRLFRINRLPVDERPEKSCFVASFIALLHQEKVIGIPFECSDYYGKSSLTFSTDDPPQEEMKAQIANAFWKLLLEVPEEVEDYTDRMFHAGTGRWVQFGIKNGESFLESTLEDK